VLYDAWLHASKKRAFKLHRNCNKLTNLKSSAALSFLVIIGFNFAAHAGDGAQNSVPVPRSKPLLETVQQPQTQAMPDGKVAIDDEFKSCVAALNRLGAGFTVANPIITESRCQVPDAVRLISVGSKTGSIALPAKPVLGCGFALRLSTWLADVAAPVVESFAQSPLVSIATGPGYQCRNRNNQKSGKISEHAFGNAIDITGFGLGSRQTVKVSTLNDGPPSQIRMLMALRISSCGYFTTVLGPGSNEAHKAHFHLDYAKRGKGWNYRICE